MLQAGPWTNQVEKIAVIFMMLAAFLISVTTSLTIIFFIMGVVLYWLAGNWRLKWHLVKINPISWFILAIFSLFIIGLFYSETSWHDGFTMIYKYGKLIFLPFLLPMFNKKSDRTWCMYAFMAGIVFLVIMSFLKIFHLSPISFSNDPSTAFHDHIQTSFEVTLGIFILSHWLKDESKPAYKLVCAVLLLIFVIFLFGFNTGRSGMVLFFPLMLTFLLQRFKWSVAVPGIFAVILLGVLTYFAVPNVHKEIGAMKNNSVQVFEHALHQGNNSSLAISSEEQRISFWHHSLKLFLQRPVFGHGTGSFNRLYRKINGVVFTNNPYNELLNFGVQFGIVGILLLLSFCCYLFIKSFSLPTSEKYIAFGVVLAYALGCLFNSWLMDAMHGYIFVLLIANYFGIQKHLTPIIAVKQRQAMDSPS